MKPMEPMRAADRWWPNQLGQPASTGGQNGLRYAVFPDARRLLVEDGGKLTTYDTADRRITGVGQQDGRSRTLSFTTSEGPVDLEQLDRVD